MITPSQIPNPYVKPKWQASVGTMESVLRYNCRKYSMPVPAGAWPMWEGAGNRARDYSGHRNHGDLIGQPAWKGEELDFNGSSDYIDLPNSSGFNNITACTIDIILRFDEYPTDGYLFGKRSAWSSTGIPFAVTYMPESGWRWQFFIKGIDDKLVYDSAAVEGEDYHITAVWTGTNQYIYMNGMLGASRAASVTTTNNNVNPRIGCRADSVSQLTNAVIKSINFYDVAVNAAQVKFLSDNPWFMYQIPEELYGYVAGAPPVGNPFWYYNMLKRRN